MRHTIIVLVGVLIGIVLFSAAFAEAALSGAYRCEAGFGAESVVWHYNPVGIPQVVRRIRIYNASGVLVLDSGPIVGIVPARGSVPVTNLFEGEQSLVNWTQAADTAPPIPRMDTFATRYIAAGDITAFAFDSVGNPIAAIVSAVDLASISRVNCP